MAIKFVELDYTQLDVDLDDLVGGAKMRAKPVVETVNAQDAILNRGRRILAQVGLHGEQQWLVPDVAPSVISQSHPSRTVPREVARTPRLDLTPGHFLRAMVLASPAGETSVFVDGDWGPGGRAGSVEIEVSFNNGGGPEVASTSMLVPPSLEDDAVQPQGAGAAWDALYTMRSALLMPPGIISPATLEPWCEGVTVEIVISHLGSPRAIDVIVYEEAYRYAADTSAGPWMLPLNVDTNGKLLKTLPSAYPVEQAVAGVVGGGTHAIVDAADRQRELAPMLWTHTTFAEGLAEVDDVVPDPGIVTSLVDIELVGSHADFDESLAGVSVSSGANGRLFETSHEKLVLRDVDNVVAVRCWVYAKVADGAESGRVRFMSADYAVVDVVVDSTSYDWHAAIGFLRCGLGPEDATVLQVFGRVDHMGDTLSWQALAVEALKA